jgi:hypothetical protein
MPVPTQYTEVQLRNYLVAVLADVGTALGWDSGSVQVVEATNDALLEAGASDISIVTDIRGLRALGRRAIWRAVVQATAGNYSFSTYEQRFDRQQVNEQAHKALELAEADCREAGGVGLSVGRLTLDFLEPASVYTW